jgi:hypothetical protein
MDKKECRKSMTAYKYADSLVIFCTSADDLCCQHFKQCAIEMTVAIGIMGIEKEIRKIFPQNSMEN